MTTRRPRRPALAAILLVATLGALAGACGGGSGGGGSAEGADDKAGAPVAAATIELVSTSFDPATATVKVGGTVRWQWGGGVLHDVAGGSFKSPVKSKGTYEHTFTTAGTFAFHCNVHPGMKGAVTVEP
jgi:plastocyanin